MAKRRMVVIVGSRNDIVKKGRTPIRYLIKKRDEGVVDVVGFHVRSIHRHPKEIRELVGMYQAMGDIDCILAVAGKAADLPCAIDAYLRNELHDYKIRVIGIGLPGPTLRDTLAAELSITDVPGNQVGYLGQRFMSGCITACTHDMHPERIEANKIPPIEDFETLEDALAITGEEEPDKVLDHQAGKVIEIYQSSKHYLAYESSASWDYQKYLR